MTSNSNPFQPSAASSEDELADQESLVEQPESAEIAAVTLGLDPDPSMQEYYRLQQQLLTVTVVVSAIVFASVWIAYSWPTALSYVLGACTGVVYLRMLSRNVAQLGRQRQRLGTGRLAIFMGLMIVATQWQQLEVLPVFLGFLTYKAAIIIYTLRVAILPE